MPNEVIVKCAAKDCLHNFKGYCDVIPPTWINITTSGQCLDHAPLTDREYKQVTGKEREDI